MVTTVSDPTSEWLCDAKHPTICFWGLRNSHWIIKGKVLSQQPCLALSVALHRTPLGWSVGSSPGRLSIFYLNEYFLWMNHFHFVWMNKFIEWIFCAFFWMNKFVEWIFLPHYWMNNWMNEKIALFVRKMNKLWEKTRNM